MADTAPVVDPKTLEAPTKSGLTEPPALGLGLVLTDESKHHALSTMFSIEPSNITELLAVAKMYAQSELVPKDYWKKPQNIVIAIQMGRSVGLSSMQALLSIAVINGRPTIWGDAIPALLYYHKVLDSEFHQGGIHERAPHEALATKTGHCEIMRKGWGEALVREFTYQEAVDAKLIERSKGGDGARGVGPWITYPGRMLQMRARGWAARDACPDILKGLGIREEVEDTIIDARTGRPVGGIRAPKTIIDGKATIGEKGLKDMERFVDETNRATPPQNSGSIAGPRPTSGAALAGETPPSNARTWIGQIVRMTQEQVGKEKKTTKYTIHGKNQEGEIKFGTIRREEMEKAKVFASTGELAKVTYTHNEQYRNNDFISIAAAEQPPEEIPIEEDEPGSQG